MLGRAIIIDLNINKGSTSPAANTVVSNNSYYMLTQGLFLARYYSLMSCFKTFNIYNYNLTISRGSAKLWQIMSLNIL